MIVKDVSCKPQSAPESRSATIKDSGRHISEKAASSFKNNSTSRITASSFAIAWGIVILVFLLFFNQYIAYYEPQSIDGVTKWIRYPVLTEAFTSWLPILVVTLILFIIGHLFLIRVEKYVIREITLAVLDLLVMAATLSLLLIFPFDFTLLPGVEIASILYMFTRVALLSIIVALGIGTLVRLIRLTVNILLHKA